MTDENIFLSNLSSHRIKQNIIMLIIAQAKAYGPIPAGKHRKSIQHESGIPDRKSPESSGLEHCFHFSLISGARNYPPDDKQISAIYVLYLVITRKSRHGNYFLGLIILVRLFIFCFSIL